MTDIPRSLNLKAKKLGVLIKDARLSKGRSIPDCAAAVGVLPEVYEAFEYGDESPSLPQVEFLAFYLNIPVDHFMGDTSYTGDTKTPSYNPQTIVKLRQKMIGVLIKQARMEAGLSIDDLAEKVGIAPELLDNYEFGDEAVPLPLLESISRVLNRPLRDFQDQQGPVGVWLRRQKAVQNMMEMPDDLISFVSKPINQPYLELAKRLSEMSVEKLRAVAEGLLEITL